VRLTAPALVHPPVASVSGPPRATKAPGLPVTAVPIGLHSSGLPIGMQVAGPFLEDHTTLAAAAVMEALVGGTPRPPGW
jgi:Asp-tRNA(Asn)/Glu-tRNA(Gln) amidotransferase A subunit family amidase